MSNIMDSSTEMSDIMDSSSLRHMEPRELALHLRHVSEQQSARWVSTQLLSLVESEALPPTVFNVFLTSVTSCPLKDALWQRHSKYIRYAAIRRFGKDLKSVHWEDAWQEVGEMEGLLDLFSQLSVLEVKNLSKAIGCCPGRSAVKNCIERQRRVTELVQCLLYPLYPSRPHQSKDQRPLYGHYAKMVPACTSDFVESLFRHQSHLLLQSPNKLLVQHHSELLLRLVLSAISREDSLEGVAADRIMDLIALLLQYAPSAPAIEPPFSASMSIALAILERITVEKGVLLPRDIFVSLLMVPLVRRLRAHKVDPSHVQQVIQLAASYLQRHKQALSPDKGDLLCYVADYWSSSPSLFEACLIELIGLLRCDLHRGLSRYQDLMQQAERAQRYDLLRIICLHNADIQVDIDSDDGLKAIRIQTWPTFVFMMLQRDHSLKLLKRLIRLKPEADFLQLDFGYTIFSQAKSPGSRRCDTRLLLTMLQTTKEAGVHESPINTLESLKSKASSSREQTDRAFFAKSAAFHAVAGKDLTLYENTVQWTRRFLRDAMTVKTVYSPDVTNTVEGIALLGGIPEDLGSWTAAEICMRIINANKIMLDFLDAAVTSLREPFFYARDWTGPLSLFQKVVLNRMSNADRLKRRFQLSEDEIYDILWTGTLYMLLQAEEIGLRYEKLGFNSPYGPLAFHSMTEYVPKPALTSFYRFVDNLARSRDSLWRRFRPTANPTVAALNPPWPRGLPIHCLVGPINVAVDSGSTHTPFIANRAAEVVFADPVVVLIEVADDKETRRAIGQFVDSFKTALAIYIMQCPPGDEQDKRAHAAWSHAVTALSRGPSAKVLHPTRNSSERRLSEIEAKLFWGNIFKQAVPRVKVPGSEIRMNEDYPIVPTEGDPQETFEWNPSARKPSDFESRKLPMTILDCMIAIPRGLQWDSNDDFQVPTPRTQALSFTPIWSYARLKTFQKIPKPVQEGMIATALLVESSKIEGSKTLASPFPSDFDVRYPSLFLDHEFLLAEDGLIPPANVALSYFIKMVPSTLLLDLAASAFDTLSRMASDSTNLASTERAAYQLLILLSKCDRPQLASNLIVRTIVNRPDASSWHRQLLRKNFVRAISAEQARNMISLFASSVLENIELQATSSSNHKKYKSSATSSNNHIKITTVKFLAQFLNDADFVAPEFCVDILSKLFQKSSHVDVRVAVLKSILSRLGRCADEPSNPLAERLMSVLEVAIPVLGSLNERKTTQDGEWTEAEKTGKLPEVYNEVDMKTFNLDAFPPMLRLVLRATSSDVIPSGALRKSLIHRVLLPVVEESAGNNARWVKMFTLKHFPADQSFRIPTLPVKPDILGYLIQNCSSEIPRYILDLYQQFVLTNISPPTGLIKLNSRIKDDVKLHQSNEGQHWLSLYDLGVRLQTGRVVSLLTEPWKSSAISDGIQISHVQEIVFEQAEALLQLGDVTFHRWNKFVISLLRQYAKTRSDQDNKAWLANAKPMLLRIIRRIDTLRTPMWQRDPARQPAVLPPTFGLRLQVLDYPHLCPSSNVHAVFAQQLVSILQEILGLGLAHHAKIDEVESALSNCLPEDVIRVACYLGNIEPEDPRKSQENMLRVEMTDKALRKLEGQHVSRKAIADRQLHTAREPHDRDSNIQSIKTMLEAWRRSEFEEIRMRGFQLGKRWGI